MTAKPLNGLKILVTAYDLEQHEHHELPFTAITDPYLHEAGAEVITYRIF